MKIILHAPFASNSKVDERDVLQLKKALNRLGYYQPYEKTGITDFADTSLFSALKNFQRDNDLSSTGEVKPDDQTLQKLNEEIKKTPEGYYIWRCVEDGKARPVHARMNRTLRAWSDHPDPGEDFNCRCWAQPTELTMDDVYSDAISPTIGPFDILSGSSLLRNLAGKTVYQAANKIIAIRSTSVEWITNAPTAQLQKKFKHAIDFGITETANKQSISTYRAALENHVKSPHIKIIKGEYHKKPVTHYYDQSTKINAIKDENGKFVTAWKLSDAQKHKLLTTGKLGGSKK